LCAVVFVGGIFVIPPEVLTYQNASDFQMIGMMIYLLTGVVTLLPLLIGFLRLFASVHERNQEGMSKPKQRKPKYDTMYVKSETRKPQTAVQLGGDIQDGEVVMDEVSDPERAAQLNEDWDRLMEHLRNGGSVG
jgi:hypothetical protein